MWGFVDCTRYFLSFGQPIVVLHEASLLVGTREKVALLIPPGKGKSTLLRLLSGTEPPNSGMVLRDDGGWPLGYSGGFQNEMSGEENVRNIAQIAGIDPDGLATFCRDFAALGTSYYEPMKFYSGTMKGQLAFAISFGVPAKTYLADDKLAVGNSAFREKCMAALRVRLADKGLIFVASNIRAAKGICDRFYIVRNGKFLQCENYEDAERRFASTFDGSDQGGAIESDELATFDLA